MRPGLRRLLQLGLACGGLALGLASAVQAAATHTVALVSVDDDERYQPRRLEKAYPGHPGGRLGAAVRLAVADTEMALQTDGLRLVVREAPARTAAELPAVLHRLKADKVAHWVLDLPASLVPQAVQAAGGAALLFNASAEADTLRAGACAPHLFHPLPSQAMRADALAQHLASRSWRQVLVLQGPSDADQALGQAWARAARRYGLKLTVKPFKLSGDPRERDLANPRLLTAGTAHDVVAVMDADGEFARTLPYATQQPRPVVGSNGLVALAWHPQWERNGGPQVSRRFRRLAERPMAATDWAAWMAVRSVAAVLQARPTASVAEQARALRSTEVSLDGSKGPRISYRTWDGQLRQPLLLTHVDGVIGVAPLDGVLHPTEVLDTLGVDEAETACKVRP
jgi:ABC transporter substrate binding protein (PQQ-dependent alcohol dehydrogenase system)